MIDDATMLAIAEAVAKAFELAGIAVIIGGTVFAIVRFAVTLSHRDRTGQDRLTTFRRRLGRAILTSLEFLVAADIIRTVAIDPTLESVIVLGIIVLIRTFLSFSLEVEIDGRWPWQKKPAADAGDNS